MNAAIKSRHPTHNILRDAIQCHVPTVVRFGSQTASNATIQINSPEAVKCSSDKLEMKVAFTNGGVATAKWEHPAGLIQLNEFLQASGNGKYVIKSRMGSRGRGLYLKNNSDEVRAWFEADSTRYNRYIVEKFYNYSREYRLHVSKKGCFYACRKMLKTDTPTNKRWFRNDSNCVWIVEENPAFDRPSNWDQIVAECVKALNAVGLDLGACDVKVQSRVNSEGQVRENPGFIIIEINSAPSFGQFTAAHYHQQIQDIIQSHQQH